MAVVGVVAFFAVHAFVAKLAIVCEKAVTAVAATEEVTGIKAIFVVVGGCDHVAVFVAPREVCIFAVCAVADQEGSVGCLFEEGAELGEEGFVEVWLKAVVAGVPVVFEPFFEAVDWDGAIGAYV